MTWHTRILIVSLFCCLILLGGVVVASADIMLSTSFRYDHARDDDSPHTQGDEYTIPFGIAYAGPRFSLGLETAYSDAYVETGDDDDSHLGGFTDTLLAASYFHTFADRPMAILFGIDVSLPTGEEHLNTEEAGAEWGESNDLFEVDNFGEGLNIGLSLGATRQLREHAAATAQIAYIVNGEFDPTKDVENDDLDPGDQLLLMGILDWQAAAWLNINAFGSYTHVGADRTNGKKNFQQGDQVVLGSNVTLSRKPFSLFGGLQTTLPTKNSVLTDDALKRESDNSNGVDVFGLIAVNYTHSSRLTLRLQGDIRHYGESDLQNEKTGQPFSGKRVRYATGPGWNFRLNPQLTLKGLLKVFLMEQERDAFTEAPTTYRGINFDISMTYTL